MLLQTFGVLQTDIGCCMCGRQWYWQALGAASVFVGADGPRALPLSGEWEVCAAGSVRPRHPTAFILFRQLSCSSQNQLIWPVVCCPQITALGIVSIFDQILEGLPEGERSLIFDAFIAALQEDPARCGSNHTPCGAAFSSAGYGTDTLASWGPVGADAPNSVHLSAGLGARRYRRDAAKLEAWASSQAALVPDEAGDEVQQSLAATAARIKAGGFLYTRFFAVGLFRLLELTGGRAGGGGRTGACPWGVGQAVGRFRLLEMSGGPGAPALGWARLVWAGFRWRRGPLPGAHACTAPAQ